MTETNGDERAALEGMLRAYPVDQLVEEVLVAWQELADRNEDLVTSKQRLRVLELDLAERKDEVAPEVAQLKAAENDLEEAGARIVHLERLLEDTRKELAENSSSISVEEREALEKESFSIKRFSNSARRCNRRDGGSYGPNGRGSRTSCKRRPDQCDCR